MQETTSTAGANVEELEIERVMDRDHIICERRIRKPSKNNPFDVQGYCDLCHQPDSRMNLAIYTIPNENCSCCTNGKHTVIVKFCNECIPESPASFFIKHNKFKDIAVERLIKKHADDYKKQIVRSMYERFMC